MRILHWTGLAALLGWCTAVGAAPPAELTLERYVPEAIPNCTHILRRGTQEVITVGSHLLVRDHQRDPWRKSPLAGLEDAHSVAYSAKTGLYYVNDTGHHRLISFRDPAKNLVEKSVSEIAGRKLDRPHDVVVDDDGWLYVLNPNPPTTVFRLRDLGVAESALDLSAELTYSRSLSLVKNRLYVIGSSVGKVIEVTDFAQGKFVVHPSFDKRKDSAAGSWTTTGLVLNDVDRFVDWWYATSYFCPTYADGADHNEHKLIRFRSWDDFQQGRWDDLSTLFPDRMVPYYLTPTADGLLITGFLHEEAQHPGGVWILRKK